ncbi:MAG: hypothetical protein LUQ44_07360 [Methanothrix sp.]|nr:hypothetical protein [Methanothrix sp.]
MKRSAILALLALLLAVMGLSCTGLSADESVDDSANATVECTCFKMTYMAEDGQNMTIDFYNPSCAGMCNENNTELLYMDSAGRCDINGKSPFCQCGPNCPVGCTCLENLTLDAIVTGLQSMM